MMDRKNKEIFKHQKVFIFYLLFKLYFFYELKGEKIIDICNHITGLLRVFLFH